ncbi:MAG: hypothetical protein E2594_17260 [Pseudomonas sp.]|nr:hypothetical protein [Pseudomonas sp.]
MKADYIAPLGTHPTIIEQWLPVLGYEGLYEVSNQGRVRSLDRVVVDKNGARTRRMKGRVLNNICVNTGYHHISLHRNNKRIARRQVQRLVAEAFLGPPSDPGMYVDRRNGIRTDNRVQNLRWVHPAVNNNNTPYTRYLKEILTQASIPFKTEEEFHESRTD